MPRGLAGYMALAFSLLSILLTFVIVAIVERKATEHVEETIGRGLAELAVQTADKLDRGMYERYREVGLLARRAELGDVSRPLEARRALLDDVLRSYRYYSWIGLAGLDGKVEVAGNGLLEGADVSQRPWFGNALHGVHVGDVHEAKLLYRLLAPQAKEPMRFVDVAFPYLGRDGKPVGVVGAHLSWTWAKDVQQSIIAPLETSRNVEAMIVDSHGTVLLGPPALQGKRLPAAVLGKGGRNAVYEQQLWADGQHYLAGIAQSQGYADYPGLGWRVLVRQNLETALVPVTLLRRYAVASGLGLALLFSLAGAFVAGWITRPLKRLAHAARNLQGGSQLEMARASGYEEVRELADSLNRLVTDLVQRREDLERLNANLESRVTDRTVELALALAEVQASARSVRTIIDIAQDAYMGIDLDGYVVDWNARAAAMFGLTRAEALNSHVERVVPERYRESVRKSLRAFAETGELGLLGHRVERVVVDRHGSEIPIEMTLDLVESGERPFFSIFLHDISLRKNVDRMKDEFIGTVSHELRTPLTSMRVSLSLLATGTAGTLDDDAQELVGIAHRQCERLVRLVDDMLDIQKIENNALVLRTVRSPLLPLVEDAVGVMRGLAGERGVTLACACACADGNGDITADVDRDRMQQVLTNLLSNAIKFSPSGSLVQVTVAATADSARISVADQGRGIPAHFRGRIFQRFAHQGANGGSGLGLSICKGIVEEHGGQLSFVSVEGEGTTFHIDLPGVVPRAVEPGMGAVAAA
jgi:PAS domain S-box-containing protein